MRKNDDLMPISKFIKILLVVIFFLGAIYLITEKLVKKDKTSNEVKTTYNEIVVGNSMTQKDTNYYVLYYNPETNIAGYLDSWQSAYIEAKKPIKLYYVDLSKTINKKFMVSDNSNPNATLASELRLKNGTLIIIANGQITNYVEDLQEIYELLK